VWTRPGRQRLRLMMANRWRRRGLVGVDFVTGSCSGPACLQVPQGEGGSVRCLDDDVGEGNLDDRTACALISRWPAPVLEGEAHRCHGLMLTLLKVKRAIKLTLDGHRRVILAAITWLVVFLHWPGPCSESSSRSHPARSATTEAPTWAAAWQ
jgi:hypothetical protein